jgi:hypothetical protein
MLLSPPDVLRNRKAAAHGFMSGLREPFALISIIQQL